MPLRYEKNTDSYKMIESNIPVGDDIAGSGNKSVTFPRPVTRIDAFNAHATDNLSLEALGITRFVPPGGRDVSWPEPFTEVEVTASGAWILTGYE